MKQITNYILVLVILTGCSSVENQKETNNDSVASDSTKVTDIIDTLKEEEITVIKTDSSTIEITDTIEVFTGEKTEVNYQLGDIDVRLIQNKGDKSEFYCKSQLITTKNNKTIDIVKFSPEPVGGNFGVSNGFVFLNHIIFTKHGDYDGRTIVVDSNGKIYDLIGGENFLDKDNKLLFSIYESDLTGFTVFDLKSDSITLTMSEFEDRPMKIHKEYNNRYFMSCINDETEIKSIWEFEFDMQRIMQVDLTEEDINESNMLEFISQKEVNCVCENK